MTQRSFTLKVVPSSGFEQPERGNITEKWVSNSTLGLVRSGQADLSTPNYLLKYYRTPYLNHTDVVRTGSYFIILKYHPPPPLDLNFGELLLAPIGLWTVLLVCVFLERVVLRRVKRVLQLRDDSLEKISINLNFWRGILLAGLTGYICLLCHTRAPDKRFRPSSLKDLQSPKYVVMTDYKITSMAIQKKVPGLRSRTVKVNEAMGRLNADVPDGQVEHAYVIDDETLPFISARYCNFYTVLIPEISKFLSFYLRPGGFRLPITYPQIVALQIRWKRLLIHYHPPRMCDRTSKPPITGRHRSLNPPADESKAHLTIHTIRGTLMALICVIGIALLVFCAEYLSSKLNCSCPTLTNKTNEYPLCRIDDPGEA